MLQCLLVAVSLGVVGAMLRVGYSFLPGTNVVDLVVFLVLGHLAARLLPERRWTMAAAAALPALVLVAFVMVGISPGEVRSGVGLAWVLSAGLIPLGAFIGAALRLPWEEGGEEPGSETRERG